MLAFPLLILAITRSPAETGLLSALASLPWTVLPLPAGVLADRCDRKRLMIVADAVRGLALASIPVALLLGHLTLAQLVLASLLEGTFATFYTAAGSSCLPQVVCPEDVPVAVGLGSASDSAARLAGPSLAGLLYTACRALPFLADALSYAVSVVSLFCIKADFQGTRGAASAGLWAEMREGLRWLWQHAQLRFLALLIGGLNVCSFGGSRRLAVARPWHAGLWRGRRRDTGAGTDDRGALLS